MKTASSLWLVLVIAGAGCAPSGERPGWPLGAFTHGSSAKPAWHDTSRPWIAGHRAAGMVGSHEFPENTIPGLTATIREGGAVGVEIDVMLTGDREIVLMHDARLDRTTRCMGCVSDKTLAEIMTCRFDSDTLDANPPSLAQALSAVGELPVVPLLILDVKSDPWVEGCPLVAETRTEHERMVGQRIGEALRDAGSARNVAVQSKVPGVLDAVREHAPEALLFALAGRLDTAVDLAHGRYDGAAAWCDAFTENGRRRARASGLYLDTYIVNSPVDLGIAVAYDVDMIESDYVPELLAWFD